MFTHKVTKRITTVITVVLAVSGLLLVFAPQKAFAQPAGDTPLPAGQAASGGSGATPTVVDTSSLPKTTAAGGKLQQIINVALAIIGAASVLAISIGGLRYVLAHGDSNAIAQAKNTILYALVGLIVVILAGVIVNFVVESVQ